MLKFLKEALITILFIGILGGVLFVFYRYVLPDEITTKIENSISTAKEELGFYEDSKITGEEYDFDTMYYPYYNNLSDTEKGLYRQIYANAVSLHTSFVPAVEIETYAVKRVIDAVYHDHPELFWMESGYAYKYTDDSICVHITLSFNETADDIETSKRLFEEKADEIIDAASTLENDYEKEKYVYKELIKRVEYNETAQLHQSAYSALVYGQSVCAGYSKAFQYIMIELGIPTYYCSGESDEHAWNIVKLEEGYYNVDVSRDDEQGAIGRYFNRTDDELKSTHERSGYSIMLPRCRAQKYSGM